jgi:hypothetical protein
MGVGYEQADVIAAVHGAGRLETGTICVRRALSATASNGAATV